MNSIVLATLAVFLVALGETSGADRQQLVKNVEDVQDRLKSYVEVVVTGMKEKTDQEIQAAKEISEEVGKCVTEPANEMAKFVGDSFTALGEMLNKKYADALQVLNDPNSKGAELEDAEAVAANAEESCGKILEHFADEKVLPATLKLVEKIEACKQK